MDQKIASAYDQVADQLNPKSGIEMGEMAQCFEADALSTRRGCI